MKVKDLIEKLHQVNPDIPIVIEDADTSWSLNILDVKDWGEYIELCGSYKDQFNNGEAIK